MREWVLALVYFITGVLAGLGVAYQVLRQGTPTPQESHHITLKVHKVPGCMCKGVPCVFFDNFKKGDIDKLCYQSPSGKTDDCYPK